MNFRDSRMYWLVGLAVLCSACSLLAGESNSAREQAQEILRASGVRGGVVVHVGCDDGRLTESLFANERYLVQGLAREPQQVSAAREYLLSRGVYGEVSVKHWHGPRLPYGDNIVDLIVVGSDTSIAPGELSRVLAPCGAVVTPRALNADSLDVMTESIDGLPDWSIYRKPVPEEIDDWTHYLHDAGNNAVADDDRVGPPRHLQWKSEPMWCRSHEFASSVQALVSSNGRLIGVIDEGIIGQPRGVPTFWALIARDAFNGKLLWRRPCSRINPHALVAKGDKVYVTLKSKGPLSILDAATGETLHTCEETGKVHELSVYENRVVLCTQLGGEDPGLHIAAADPENGELLWKKSTGPVAANTLVAGNHRVCYRDQDELVCLKLESGEEQWRTEVKKRRRGYAVMYEGAVFLTGGSTRAFSLENGKLLWTGPDGNPHARNPPGLFGADGLIWSAWGHVGPRSFVWQHQEEEREGRDPITGKVRKTVKAERLVTAGHHIRCYPPKATSRYLLLNKRGVEFFDLREGEHMRANWTRGACGFGMLPANGFLYTPPSQCFCYQGVLLAGLNALATSRTVPASEITEEEQPPRLRKGPAYAARGANGSTSSSSSADWPTYRHDVYRSGSREAALPVEVSPVWETSICPPAYGSEQKKEADVAERLILSATEATIHGDGARKSGDAIIAWRGKNTFATWQADIQTAGRQPVWLLQANRGQGGSVFELSIGSETLTGKIRHTDSWEQYIWIRAGEIEVAEPGIRKVTIKPLQQVEGRLGNVKAIAIGGQKPPQPDSPPKLRERPDDILTPPVAAGGKIFVAEPEAHAVHALRASDGEHLWRFVAAGRIDSPPTIHQGLCIFGSTSGHVYCLSADDGTLAWRFQAAPEERQVCVRDQLESAWPVHGSVLVRDGKVYCTSGRSSHLDGGIHVYALDPYSGQVLHKTDLRSEEPDVSKYGGRPFDMKGAKTDLLVAGEEDIYLFQNRFNPDLTRDKMPRITKLGDRKAEPHLMTTDGFLDKTWFNRTYWIHGERWPGYYFTYRAPKSGQVVVFDDTTTYALKVYRKRHGHSPEFQPGSGYQLIADRNSTKPVLHEMDIGAEKGRGFSRTELPMWSRKIPIRVQGMLLADKHLYLAGPPDLTTQRLAYEAMIGKRNSVFQVVSAADGSVLAELELPAAVVFDGLIAAGDRLYTSTMSGNIICLGEKK